MRLVGQAHQQQLDREQLELCQLEVCAEACTWHKMPSDHINPSSNNTRSAEEDMCVEMAVYLPLIPGGSP